MKLVESRALPGSRVRRELQDCTVAHAYLRVLNGPASEKVPGSFAFELLTEMAHAGDAEPLYLPRPLLRELERAWSR